MLQNATQNGHHLHNTTTKLIQAIAPQPHSEARRITTGAGYPWCFTKKIVVGKSMKATCGAQLELVFSRSRFANCWSNVGPTSQSSPVLPVHSFLGAIPIDVGIRTTTAGFGCSH
ncbi:hypothetical protein V6N13_020943 [Hibiscus sabdariffa]|uniref:Uncharacterized protein n=1 Tax=Hibiscus sabdariffa TaxID=183260 RepID=A0ABR2EV03_9ROSI